MRQEFSIRPHRVCESGVSHKEGRYRRQWSPAHENELIANWLIALGTASWIRSFGLGFLRPVSGSRCDRKCVERIPCDAATNICPFGRVPRNTAPGANQVAKAVVAWEVGIVERR